MQGLNSPIGIKSSEPNQSPFITNTYRFVAGGSAVARIGSISYGATPTISSTTFTYTHTNASGSNRIMLVSIGTEKTGGADVTGIDYGGQALVNIADALNGTSVNNVEMWYLLESGIASASNTTITITQSGGTTKTASCAISYEGVDQTTPVSEYATDVTAVATHTGLALTEATGNLLVVITGNGSAYTPTYPSTMTEQHDSNDYTSVGTQITLGDRLSITDGSIDPAPTMSGVTRNTGISVEIGTVADSSVWEQLSTGQSVSMKLNTQECIQEFQTGFEIIGYKIVKVEWSVKRSSGTGNNLSFRCEVVDSSCVTKATIGSDVAASGVGSSFEFIEFVGSADNYAITNTDMLKLKIVGTGSTSDSFSGELCSSCTIANTRGGYDNGSCSQTWYTDRNSTIKVTYQAV